MSARHVQNLKDLKDDWNFAYMYTLVVEISHFTWVDHTNIYLLNHLLLFSTQSWSCFKNTENLSCQENVLYRKAIAVRYLPYLLENFEHAHWIKQETTGSNLGITGLKRLDQLIQRHNIHFCPNRPFNLFLRCGQKALVQSYTFSLFTEMIQEIKKQILTKRALLPLSPKECMKQPAK